MNKPKVVTLRPMGNKDMSKEPETKELKRMILDGELDPGRPVEHLKEADDKQREPNNRKESR